MIGEKYKLCPRCGIVKLRYEDFYKLRNNPKTDVQGHCKQCHKADVRKYQQNNYEKWAAWSKKSRRPNYWTEYSRQKMAKDLRYTLAKRFRTSVYAKIKRNDSRTKDLPVFATLGYTVDDLIGHLEKLFSPGMSWDNYGKWHIDHKIPDVSFEYSSMSDVGFRECWALDNLQPLWAKDNLSKGSRTDVECCSLKLIERMDDAEEAVVRTR